MSFNLSARSPNGLARSSAVCRRLIIGVMAVVAASAVGACASGHSHKGGGGDRSIVVHLTNDLTPPSDVTVYAVGQDGIRRLLGDVPPNKARALKIPGEIFPGTTFHLVAEPTGGRPVRSQPITATNDAEIIDWDLQTNALWYPTVGN
jgi:hypothetical protein